MHNGCFGIFLCVLLLDQCMSVAMLTPFGNNIKSLNLRLFLNVRCWQYGPPDAHCDALSLISSKVARTPFLGHSPRSTVWWKKQRSLSWKGEYSQHGSRTRIAGRFGDIHKMSPPQVCSFIGGKPSRHYWPSLGRENCLCGARSACTCHSVVGGCLLTPILFPIPILFRSWLNLPACSLPCYRKLRRDTCLSQGDPPGTVVTTSERSSKRGGWQGQGLLLTLLSDTLDSWDLVSGGKMVEFILVT